MKTWISVLIIMVPAIVFAILDKPLMLAAMLIPCFITVGIINMDKLQSFKAGDFEAQFREQVQQVEQVIEEAHVTIDQLKEMTVPLLDYSLANIISDNRTFTGVSAFNKEQFYLKAIENIEKFKIESENTVSLLKSVRNEVAVTYLLEVVDEFEKCNTSDYDTNKVALQFYDTFKMENAYLDHSLLPQVSAVKQFFSPYSLSDVQSFQQKIDHYDRFLSTYIQKEES